MDDRRHRRERALLPLGLSSVRTATIADAHALALIHVDVWRSAYADLLPRTVLDALSYEEREDQWRAHLDESASPEHIFCAWDGHEIVGFASCGPNRTPRPDVAGELYAIYVSDIAQGQGHGTRLLNAVAQDLRTRALTPYMLWALAENAPAIAFYERHGGREITRVPALVRDASVMECGFIFGDS